MSRLQQLFTRKKARVLNVYCTAGYPELNSTLGVMQAVQEAGADIIELGIPYSDPLADGPVIQSSGAQALANGMNLETLFRQLKHFRNTIQIPVVLMGYLNPVLQYGFERFCATAAELGIDGLILPDLPLFEFETDYKAILQQHNLDLIFLVTPETPEARVLQLDQSSSGFLYAVSSSSTTGGNKDFNASEAYLQRLQNLNLKNPVLVGFGVKDKATFNAACAHAAGAIIGSAYIKAIENAPDIAATTKQFINEVTSA